MNFTKTPIYEATSNTVVNKTVFKHCPPLNFSQEIRLKLETERWCLGFEFFLAIFGNTCLLIALWKRKENWSRMYMYILHLGVSDFLVAFFFILPAWLERMLCGFHGSNSLCIFTSYMRILSMFGSTLVLLAVAVDRYMAICHPFNALGKSRKQVHITVVIMWAFAAVLSLPQVFIFKKFGKSCQSSLEEIPNKFYVTWYLLAILVIPSFLLTFFYGMISFTISKNISGKKKASRAESQGLTIEQTTVPRSSNTEGISKAKIKTVKMTVVIVSTYVFCWMPFFVIQMLTAWRYEFPLNAVSLIIPSAMEILGCLNSCINPWIFILFNGRCCTDLKNFRCWNNKKGRNFQDRTNSEAKSRYFKSQISTDCQTENTIVGSYAVGSPILLKNIEKSKDNRTNGFTEKSV